MCGSSNPLSWLDHHAGFLSIEEWRKVERNRGEKIRVHYAEKQHIIYRNFVICYRNFGSNWKSACRFVWAETQKQTLHPTTGPSQKDVWMPLLQPQMGNKEKNAKCVSLCRGRTEIRSPAEILKKAAGNKLKLPKRWKTSVKGHLGNSAWDPQPALLPYPPMPKASSPLTLPPPYFFTSEENLTSPSLQRKQCCNGSFLLS